MLEENDQNDEDTIVLDILTIERTKQRSLDVVFDSKETSECYVNQQKSPLHAVTIWTCPTGIEASWNTQTWYTNPFNISALFAGVQYNQY